MKLRFHKNSLRFRLNQLEVNQLASGASLVEEIWFPDAEQPFRYSLGVHESESSAQFGPKPDGIGVLLKRADVKSWAASHELELHQLLPTRQQPLRLMVEKDLECVEAPAGEQDPYAFPRSEKLGC